MAATARTLTEVQTPFMTDQPPATTLRSIQGEQETTRQLDLFMPQEDVDLYVDSVDDQILLCRERGRHSFPSAKETGLRFNGGVDEETGLLVRRVMCTCCRLAERVEYWDVKHRGTRVTRCEYVGASVVYHTEHTKDGGLRRYTNKPGHGRMKPKQVKTAVATGMLAGTVSYRDLLKAAKQANDERLGAR